MSATFRISAGAIAIGLHCLTLSSSVAQNATTKAPADVKPAQARSDASDPLDQRGTTRNGQSLPPAGQSSQSARDQTRPATPSRQPSTSNYRGPQANAPSRSEDSDQFFANCLLADNKAEVELSELAKEKSENTEVKKFAELMIEDHSKLIQELQQVASKGAGEVGTPNATQPVSNDGRVKPGALGTRSTDATQNSSERNRGTLPGSSGANNTTAQEQPNVAGGVQRNGSAALQEITSIDRQIKERCTQAAKEELQMKSGSQFDKAYVGSAISAHVHALAALDVIGQQSQGQLAQIAQKAKPTVQQHLDHAKELMIKLEDPNATDKEKSSQSTTSRSE